jgi:hypothetical protein
VIATDDERRHQHGRTAEHAAGKSTATVELEEAGHAVAIVGDNLRIRIEDKVAAVELEDVAGADARATTSPA